MMRAAIYSRVSTSDKGQDPEVQACQLREFVQRMDWKLVAEYQDHESGSRTNRAGFQRMLADASERKFDVLVFWALDRLTREGVGKTLDELRRLNGYGIKWRSLKEPELDTTTAHGELLVSVFSYIARAERQRLQERVNAGIAKARVKGTKSGKPIGRPRIVFDRHQVVKLRDGEKLSWREIARRTKQPVRSVRRAYQTFSAATYRVAQPVEVQASNGPHEQRNQHGG
jgi:DNA invertase Pin-like site-specific DNA recombinase